MFILEFELENITEKERDIIPDFCDFLNDNIISILDSKKMRKKIQIRLNYLYTVMWIEWYNKKLCTIDSIYETFHSSLDYKSNKLNSWTLFINTKNRIPGSLTSMDRLIRFLNFGDLNFKGTGFLTMIINKFNNKYLTQLWRLFVINRLGAYPKSRITRKD